MSDSTFTIAQRHLQAEGPCRFDIPQNLQFDWMRAFCAKWTGGRLKMLGARTLRAEIRILPVNGDQLIVWDYEYLSQLEYLLFVLQFDNDDELKLLAHWPLFRFAAMVLLAKGKDYVVHSGQLLRGLHNAIPNRSEIEQRQRGKRPYDSESITVTGYLVFFHEVAHYLFRTQSPARIKYFDRAALHIEMLLNKTQRVLSENAVHSSLEGLSEPPEPYLNSLNEFLTKNQRSPIFIEEVACDLFAIENIFKQDRTNCAPDAIARLYTAVMMAYQIQASFEGLRRIYMSIENLEQTSDSGNNTENQIRNDIRGFYFTDLATEALDPSIWPSYQADVRRLYTDGVRNRYWRLVLNFAAASVIAKAHDKRWLAECNLRIQKLNYQQRKEIQRALITDFGFNGE